MPGFEDDIDADIAAAIESPEPASQASSPASDAVLPSEPLPDKAGPVASEGERARDEHGRFVAKTADAPQATEKPAQTQEPAAPVAAQTETIPAPTNWMGAGKVEWARLPAAVQKHISDDYARIAKADQELQQWGQVITPERAQAFAAQYGSTQAAIRQLLNISDYATKDKPGFIRWFAEQNRIDLNQLVQGAPQGQQAQAGDPNPYERKIETLENQLRQLVQQQQTQAQTTVLSEIEAFARDPNHPYFNDVREHMGALMKAGKAATLQEAYDMATWAVPSVRQSLLQAQTQQAMQQNAQKVQAAKQAAGSITGSPAGAIIARDEPDTDLESTIRKQVNALV